MGSWSTRLAEALLGLGLARPGVVSAARYDAAVPPALCSRALFPGARSILVVANAGPSFFRRFLDDVAGDVRRLTDEAHPLDAFTQRTFAAVEPLLAEDGERFRRFSPAFSAVPRLDFARLGVLAGLGAPSELGLLVHPDFGPWFAFRQAIFTTRDLPDSAPMTASPCDGCPAPCRAACPIGIVGPAPFDWAACAAAGGAPGPCASGCDARLACVVAPEMRYDPVQILFHADAVRGREAILGRAGPGC